ncbi:endolytic transglycosylase MltG [Aquicella lusitana]|uniref:Endolytic murein transglycosylase n=1 Tax=Aquicella lusitana TaxID=254246 RepID=A0A370GRY7_9COXI|nr:endolytic transglycosylase MltG [Aquicella lusitana]RDI46016.1 UPF0755 protein [Aquicella lusitana]VVC73387.1 hypothetical protein AQULUS_11260 [Aquicella lusitana]
MKKSISYTLIVGVLLLGSFLGFCANALFSKVVTEENGVTYYLRPGISKKVVITELSQQGIIRHPLLFSLYVYPQKSSQLKTGEYLFPKGSTPASIWKQLTNGTGHVYHPFTIVPGWTFHQLREALNKAEGLRHVTSELNDKQIMERLGYPDLAPEGQFFPETYSYTRNNPDLVILKRAFDYMQKRLKEAWQNRAPDLPYKNEYEALTAASLIEKEAYLDAERPVIAGVLVNRIRHNMPLQFDPTVIYGMGDRYAGKIHKENLQEDTAYNTYVHKGLPPTPIAMPSLVSIEAAMHPQQNDYYYFVAKGDGSHQFSRTLDEHNTAVAKSIKRRESYFNPSRIQEYLNTLFPGTLKNYSQNAILLKAYPKIGSKLFV